MTNLHTTTAVKSADGAADLATCSTRELVAEFADALTAGDLVRLRSLLADDVIARTPGRSHLAGDHTGVLGTVEALCAPPAPGVRVTATQVVEVLVDGTVGLVVVEIVGVDAEGAPFTYETAFHLATDGERVRGITEYSGDQYRADSLIARPPAEPPRSRWRWRLTRRR